MRQRRRGGLALALIGIGIAVVSVAFTLSPPEHVDRGVFWSTMGLGIAVIAIGVALLVLRPKSGADGKTLTPEEIRKRQLLAAECRRVSDSLAEFIVEWKRTRPRTRPFRDGEPELRRWRRAGEERYREAFRPWALRVFDAAVDLDGVAPESRVFIDSPSYEHLGQIPALFRDVARSLDPALAETSLSIPALRASPM